MVSQYRLTKVLSRSKLTRECDLRREREFVMKFGDVSQSGEVVCLLVAEHVMENKVGCSRQAH
jgi:hypothetical protein